MEHPIQGLMDTAMTNIKAMVDVNTIVGTAVTAPDGTIIIPISTVSFGFGAGGSEFGGKNEKTLSAADDKGALFGGGCGGGANVKPVAFLVVGNGTIKLLPMESASSPVNKIIDLVPEMVTKVNGVLGDLASKISAKKAKKEAETGEKQVVDVI